MEEELVEESIKEEAQNAAQKPGQKTREPQAANDRADHAELMMSATNQPVIPKDDPRLPKFIVVGVMKCGTGATQVRYQKSLIASCFLKDFLHVGQVPDNF